MMLGFGVAARNVSLSQGRRAVGRAAWTHPFPARFSAVGWCGAFLCKWGGVHPSATSYSPVELTALIDPAPCWIMHGVHVLPFQPIRQDISQHCPYGLGNATAPELPPSLPQHVCAGRFLSTPPFIFPHIGSKGEEESGKL